jgi:ubiquinone/menaquinone biosynthesis C-methylase UbiE
VSREWTESARSHAIYWDELSEEYLAQTRISLSEVHYGPLLPGESELGLLPCSLQGAECLELGCGAGQNSIVMAKAGAVCTALDVSEAMLNQGRRLAEQAGVEITFLHGDLDALPGLQPGSFDLIHSAYGIPFSSDPETLIRNGATLLKPGGTLLFSMGHPVYAGEWLDLEENRVYFSVPISIPLRMPGTAEIPER